METIEWLDEREAAAWRGLQFMQMRLDAALARQLADESTLSFADFVVLVALTDQDDGRLRSFELAETLGWDKSRVSHHLRRMGGRGLVDKEECPTDRRGHFVVVTQAGREAIEAAAPGHVAAVRRLFLDLVTDDELDTLIRITTRVLDHLESQE